MKLHHNEDVTYHVTSLLTNCYQDDDVAFKAKL